MFFIESTLAHKIATFQEAHETGNFSREDLQKFVNSNQYAFIDQAEATKLSDLIDDGFTVTVSPAYLGADRIRVDDYQLQVTSVFRKDGYVFYSDGVSAVSPRKILDEMIEAARQVLATNA